MLKSIVTSLELSRQLKQIGIAQKSFFTWEFYSDKCYAVRFIPYAVVPNIFNEIELISAFTAQELWEMIDISNFYGKEIGIIKSLTTGDNFYSGIYGEYRLSDDKGFKSMIFESRNIANCLAQLIIAQHEEGEKCS